MFHYCLSTFSPHSRLPYSHMITPLTPGLGHEKHYRADWAGLVFIDNTENMKMTMKIRLNVFSCPPDVDNLLIP